MHLTRHRTVPLVLLALIVAAAMAVRIGPWTGMPLWLDEAYSAYAAAHGFAFLWEVVPRYETHPPFYYSLLRLWTLAAGDSLHSLRALGYCAAALGLVGIAAAAREVARALKLPSARPALMAVLLAAAAPVLIEMSREVRPYPVMILAYALAIACAVRLGHQAAARGTLSWKTLALYAAALETTMWLHSLGLLFGGAIGLALALVVLRPGLAKRDWLLLVGAHLIVAALYVPALLILADQAPTWVKSTWLKFDSNGLEWRLAYLYATRDGVAIAAALWLSGCGVVALGRRREGWRYAGALLVLALLPVAASILISLTISPVFIVRVVSPAAVPALLLMAFGAVDLPGRWRWAGVVPAIALLASMAWATWERWPPPPRQDWYPVLRWLAARHQPGDLILAYPNEGALPFDFAARDLKLPLRAEPVPGPVPSFDVAGAWYPTGSRGVVSLPGTQLAKIAERPRVQAAATIWLLRLGPWAYDKGDRFKIELARGRRLASWYRHGPIDLIGLTRLKGRGGRAGAAAAR